MLHQPSPCLVCTTSIVYRCYQPRESGIAISVAEGCIDSPPNRQSPSHTPTPSSQDVTIALPCPPRGDPAAWFDYAHHLTVRDPTFRCLFPRLIAVINVFNGQVCKSEMMLTNVTLRAPDGDRRLRDGSLPLCTPTLRLSASRRGSSPVKCQRRCDAARPMVTSPPLPSPPLPRCIGGIAGSPRSRRPLAITSTSLPRPRSPLHPPAAPLGLQITTLLELRRRLGCECPRCRLELSIEGERRATLHRTGSVSGRDIGLQRLPGIIAQRVGPTTPTTKKGMVAGARGAGVAPRRSAGSSDRVDQSPDFIDASSQETPMNSLFSGANRPPPPLTLARFASLPCRPSLRCIRSRRLEPLRHLLRLTCHCARRRRLT